MSLLSASRSQTLSTPLPARAWWFGLLLILLLAAGLRLLSYDFSLPYIDHVDEPNYHLGALEWRGLMEESGYYTYFPPAYLAITVAVQSGLEILGNADMAHTIQVLRLLSVLADLFTIVLIAHTVSLVTSNSPAALIAGLSWAVAPLVLEHNVYARPDPLNAMLAALAIWFAANTLLLKDRGVYSVWSVIAGLAATLLKYSAFPLLLPGVLTAFILAVRLPRRGLAYLISQTGLIAATAFWLFVGYGIPIASVEREGATIRDSGLANLLNFDRLVNNLYFAVYPLRPPIVILLIMTGLAILLVKSRRSLMDRSHLLLAFICVTTAIAVSWMVASFAVVEASYRMRDVLPATVAVTILLGIAIDQLVQLGRGRWRIVVSVLLMAVLTVSVYIPQLDADVRLVRQRRAPDLRVDLRQWFDVNLDPGTVIVTDGNGKTFNPLWGGIPYRHWVDWWKTDNMMEYSVAEWRDDRGMSYTVIPLHQWEAMQATDTGRDYLTEMLHLRDFTSAAPVRGPQMVVYRLWRMMHETAVQFGDHITLVGYDLSADTLHPGDQAEFRLYWNASATPADNYSLFMHLIPADEYRVLAQFDGPPAVPERLTLTWDAPSETLISPPLLLAIPEDVPPGIYRVMIGLYNFETGVRLPVQDSENTAQGDAYLLTTLEVGPEAEPK